ncbi:carboxypeptidase-like regulatory domain-containing protein [Acidipila sp. EB88]|uniref:TonB-dependent receptor n=1 Tax=Acidipila sp. EB88 TaxID=2305226 RepID=UPI000F5E4A9C|nr:carboxypeptidase-like regulatory domain-containing protein [Acidipila sp. EB88]RRA49076.1 carboxypeptidase regulatory-like domain-containing protein [Acidipila sp. EB88]
MQRTSPKLTQYASALLASLVLTGIAPFSSPFATMLHAQSTISGDISGVVTDNSGAIVPNAQVTIKNTATGSTQKLRTNASGNFRASLLQPGAYSVAVEAEGFSATTTTAQVSVGQLATANVTLGVGAAATNVQVNASGGLMQTEQAEVSTSFSMQQIQNVPNPGGDLTYIAQVAPGSVMNNGGGYGNFSSFGLPATSNLFTVDGANENDPFLNINNSGATNILLGSNDIEQATVTSNGYQGQYGGLGGANVNYVTRSGSNKFHGDLKYYWNGSTMNANDWLNNHDGTPRPFDNANQWAADIGGPIVKDKSFFFVNTEGLRLVIPTSQTVFVPSAAYQAAVLASIPTTSIPFYQQMFNLYNTAPGIERATEYNGDANRNSFRSNVSNQTNEYLISARFDQQFGEKDHMFIHFRTDHGVQATLTDPINSAFNATSVQPQYEGQLNETHAFSPNLTNQFIAAGSWYSATFNEPNRAAALALLPEAVAFASGYFSPVGHDVYDFPQGRKVSQYQFIDDVTKVIRNHTVKFGVSYKRNDVTDYGPQQYVAPSISDESLQDFAAGNATVFQQNFPQRQTEPIALYGLAGYVQDEWKATPALTLTASLRVEHNSNPVCQTNCFANLQNGVASLDGDTTQAYNAKIASGLHTLFPSYDQVSYQPRVGFNYAPASMHGNTVVRGGFGVFADVFPGTVAENLFENAPNINTFTINGAGLAPGVAGSATATAAASNQAFLNNYAAGASYSSLTTPGSPTYVAGFSAPSFTTTHPNIHYPTYYEYNLAVQQLIARNTTLTFNYVGNHGIHEAVVDPSANSFFTPDSFTAASGFNSTLRNTVPDGSFSQVTEVRNQADSNDNTLAVSLQHTSKYLTVQANYSWQHSMDEISNGGFLPFTDLTNVSISAPIDPTNLRAQYGSSDYDIRNNFTLAYVFTVPKFYGPRVLSDGWLISGTVFAHSGSPYSITDSQTTGDLSSDSYYGTVLATPTGRTLNKSCDAKASVDTPCFGAAPSYTTAADGTTVVTPGSQFTFGQSFLGQRRNSFVGPNYFDTDMSVYKSFSIQRYESAKLQLGAQFVNLFNHANFDQPLNDVAQGSAFGTTQSTVSSPTSIFGSFLGGDASPRQIQLTARFQF